MAGHAAILPSAASVAPKAAGDKKKKRRRGRAASTGLRSRLFAAKGRTGQIMNAAVTYGEVVGAGALASALSGYRDVTTADSDKGFFGSGLQIGPVDARIPVGLGLAAAGLWNNQTNQHLIATGAGVLGSWAHELAYDLGNRWAPKPGATEQSASAPAAEAPAPEATKTGGVVVGYVDEVGLFKKKSEEEKADKVIDAEFKDIQRRMRRKKVPDSTWIPMLQRKLRGEKIEEGIPVRRKAPAIAVDDTPDVVVVPRARRRVGLPRFLGRRPGPG